MKELTKRLINSGIASPAKVKQFLSGGQVDMDQVIYQEAILICDQIKLELDAAIKKMKDQINNSF